MIDGPTLRTLREEAGVSLRQVARQADMSHTHLSKLERGEPGRTVTPWIVAAYEVATGRPLRSPDPANARPGQLIAATNPVFTGTVAAVAWGRPLRGELPAFLARRCGLPHPERLDADGVAQLTQVAELLDSLPGPVAGLIARAVLGWAAGLVRSPDPHRDEVYAVIARLATRAAHAGAEIGTAGSHDVARNLELVALHAASRAGRPELRARALVDIATHLHDLGHHAEAQQVCRIAEVDERIPDATRKLIHEVRTRAADAEQPEVAE